MEPASAYIYLRLERYLFLKAFQKSLALDMKTCLFEKGAYSLKGATFDLAPLDTMNMKDSQEKICISESVFERF